MIKYRSNLSVMRFNESGPISALPKMTREHTASFHQFLLFPGEIQNLVWDEAAALSPAGIQFLNLNSQASSWESEDITLIPSKQSAALNTVHLSLACRAARAAVLRYEKNITNKTYLRGDDKPRMNLTVDLRRDLICFGNGPGEQDARAVVNGSEGSHIVFSVARRLGIKYKKGWELPGHGPFQHDRRCSVGWRKEGLETTGGSDEGFCSWCVARVVERFKMLEEVWIIVDGGDDEVENSEGTEGIQGWNGTSKSLEMRRFEGYDLSYVSTGRCQQGNRSVKEASEVLERIKCNLMDPRFSRGSWARKLQMGILTSCRS